MPAGSEALDAAVTDLFLGYADATPEQLGHRTKGEFEASFLSDTEKELLCRDLLAEFGVVTISATNKGELIHQCSLPWHHDNNPSASLNYKKLTYNCFSCGSSGGLLWYIGVCRDTTGEQAQRWLAEQTGAGPDGQSLSALLDFFDSVYGPKASFSAPIPKMSLSVLEPWYLLHPYMTETRGIPEETLRRFRVGWNPDSDRIVIPHIWRDNLVGWQTRRLSGDGPKYKSSPDFPKDSTVYNYDSSRSTAVVVESPMSVLSKFHAGAHIEATFGAEVNDKQIRHLSMHRRVVLWFDNDTSGWKATEHVGEALESYSSVFVVPSPWAADPADLDDETYADLLDQAIPFSLWVRPEELQPWGVAA